MEHANEHATAAERSHERPEPGARGIVLARVKGVPLRIDPSWLLIFFLVAWSAASYFPQVLAIGPRDAIVLSIVAALALFASIVVHELAHALVARSLGYEVHGITLFMFGGVSEIEGEPRSGADELWIAVVGPATSLAIAVALYATARLFEAGTATSTLLHYVGVANVALAVFNLLPGFPLDGGRLLRGVLRLAGQDMLRATWVASRVGKGMGMALIAFGVAGWFVSAGFGGLWLALIGWFVRQSAETSYRQTLFRSRIEGLTAGDVASRLAPLDPDETLGDALLGHGLLGGSWDLYPVAREGKLVGTVETRALLRVPRAEWAGRHVSSFLRAADALDLDARETLARALDRMGRANRRTLAVHGPDGAYVGVVRLDDLIRLANAQGGAE
jgi:Zn-dependent protease